MCLPPTPEDVQRVGSGTACASSAVQVGHPLPTTREILDACQHQRILQNGRFHSGCQISGDLVFTHSRSHLHLAIGVLADGTDVEASLSACLVDSLNGELSVSRVYALFGGVPDIIFHLFQRQGFLKQVAFAGHPKGPIGDSFGR